MQEYSSLNCAVSSGFLSTLIFETTYRQTLSLILQEQGVRPYKAHTSLRRNLLVQRHLYL
jgi:hypothetical protein